MKKLFFALMAVSVLVGCNKNEDNDTTNNNNGTPGMSAKIDGAAKTYGAPTINRQNSSGTDLIQISSATAAGETIRVTVYKTGSITTGVYGTGGADVFFMTTAMEQFVASNIVNVTVTAIDANHIEGTFAGTAESNAGGGVTKAISEGKFYAKF
jgi:hypothetical protein